MHIFGRFVFIDRGQDLAAAQFPIDVYSRMPTRRDLGRMIPRDSIGEDSTLWASEKDHPQ